MGDYTVSLSVTDPAGATATDTVVVSVFTPASVSVMASDASASETGAGSRARSRSRRTGSTAGRSSCVTASLAPPPMAPTTSSLSGSVTIPAGQTSVVVTVAPVNDPDFEGAETVDVTVQPGGAYTVGSPSTATVTIRRQRSSDGHDCRHGSLGRRRPADPGTFTITRTGPTTAPLWVSFVPHGTAQGGVDYVALGQQVTIPAGASSVTLTVTPLADAQSEGPETVDMYLTPNPGLTVGTPGFARVVIAAN